ncbi:hypothetical protein [Wolbachia endosymbiont of Oedothorax gibbosus]|uniref:hypothetical protein n=1 Tax=Wolbachia endosymbiont of Oedothorax gibbosus TaxID=931100 RepID=UPI002024965B|nr:hypothetical protein [Wolbachia endosymbiont of Oedothorax gibbosus]
MNGIFSQYKERFVPNAQRDLMNIVESDEQMFQDYKKFLNREEIDGICRYLCEYVTLNDLLVNKESFVKVFDSTEKKRSLIGDLIKKVKDGEIILEEARIQRASNEMDKVESLLGKKIEISRDIFKRLGKDKQEDFIKDYKQAHKRLESLALVMKKPRTLTVADLNLASMNQNRYMQIYYSSGRKNGHAVLIKKNSNDSFAFYDPNYGVVFDLTGEDLCEVVTQSFYSYREGISKLGIVVLFTLPISVVAGIVAAVYGYNIIATVSLIICLVDLSILCSLQEKLVLQEYGSIALPDEYLALRKELEIELENIIDKYSGSDGKSKNTAIVSGVQVENINQETPVMN